MIEFEEGKYTSTYGATNLVSKIFHEKRRQRHWVPSMPLGQMLRAVGVAHVDLFSLDVEGSEAMVLSTMDWSIPVRVWCIEYIPTMTSPSVNQSIHRMMREHGYMQVPWTRAPLMNRHNSNPNQLWLHPQHETFYKPAWKQWDGRKR